MTRFGGNSNNTTNTQTSTMTDERFRLFMMVIQAAKSERFMHGNGAQWFIIDQWGQKVMVDTDAVKTVLVPDYDGTPHYAWSTAQNIERMLMCTDGIIGETTMPYDRAFNRVRDHVADGHLVHTNGGQWTVYIGGTVMSFDLSTKDGSYGHNFPTARVCIFSAHASWRYMEMMGGNTYRHPVSESSKKFFGLVA